METKTWSMAEGRSAESAACDFRCLHRTARGRIFHCPQFRRVVIEFGGTCLVLRPGEFQRLCQHLGRIVACALTRSRLAGGERIRLRDATGEKALILDLAGLEEMSELMVSGYSRLAFSPTPGVAESPAASPGAHPLSIGAERPDQPYQSAFIDNAIAVRAFQFFREGSP